MSLTVNGVWKAGVWATTVWADGVWREGAVEPPVEAPSGSRGSGGRVYAYLPPEPKRKRKKVIEKPTPYEVSGPLSRQREIENTTLPQWDEEAWEASLKSLKYLEEEKRQERRKRQKRTEAALLLLLLR